MKTWVVRVIGTRGAAKVTMPRLLLVLDRIVIQILDISPLPVKLPDRPLMPNCTMKPEMTRKKRHVIEKSVLDQIVKAVGADAAPSRDAPR